MAKKSFWIKYPKNFWIKTGGLLIILSVCFLFFGCVSTVPVLYTDNPKKDFTILGAEAGPDTKNCLMPRKKSTPAAIM